MRRARRLRFFTAASDRSRSAAVWATLRSSQKRSTTTARSTGASWASAVMSATRSAGSAWAPGRSHASATGSSVLLRRRRSERKLLISTPCT